MRRADHADAVSLCDPVKFQSRFKRGDWPGNAGNIKIDSEGNKFLRNKRIRPSAGGNTDKPVADFLRAILPQIHLVSYKSVRLFGQRVRGWQAEGRDAEPALSADHPWMAAYQREGRTSLAGYLGTPLEIDFSELNDIISRFKNGAEQIMLKRMGRDETALWYERVDFTDVRVLVIEWTHGNSDHLHGVDVPVLLNSTPSETLAYRKARHRDGGTDSPFTTMVLTLEQKLLEMQAHKAGLIISKAGTLMTYREYRLLMAEE